MRLTSLIFGATLMLGAPVGTAMADAANGWYEKPQRVENHGTQHRRHDKQSDGHKSYRDGHKSYRDGHSGYRGDHAYRHDKKRWRNNRHNKHDRHHGHRWDKKYGHHYTPRYAVGHHVNHDYYRHARVLHRDRHHGFITINIDGYVLRLLENSLEIVEILHHHR